MWHRAPGQRCLIWDHDGRSSGKLSGWLGTLALGRMLRLVESSRSLNIWTRPRNNKLSFPRPRFYSFWGNLNHLGRSDGVGILLIGTRRIVEDFVYGSWRWFQLEYLAPNYWGICNRFCYHQNQPTTFSMILIMDIWREWEYVIQELK